MAFGLLPIHTANLEALKAIGRSDWFLKLEVIKQTIWLVFLLISVQFGVKAIAISEVIAGVVCSFVNAWPNRKLIHYSYGEQLRDILPSFVLSGTMAVIVTFVGRINQNDLIVLVLQVLTGVVVYIAFSALFKVKSFYYIFDMAKQFFKQK